MALPDPLSVPNLVRVNLGALGHTGRVFIGDHEISGVVRGATVIANVHEFTEVTLDLSPATLDITAEGIGRVDRRAHDLLVALGWTPPGESTPQYFPVEPS